MPLHRRNSTGQVEGELQYLEEITEAAELEDDHLHEITCSAPKDFSCLRGGQGEHIFDLSCTVKLICNNTSCTQSRFMHRECFEVWQESVLNYLNKLKDGQKKTRNWSDKQKLQNLWKQGYNLVIEACGCRCGHGHLRKDLNWMPPKSQSNSGPNSDSEKHKRRRKKSSKNSKPALTIGLPNFGLNGSQVSLNTEIFSQNWNLQMLFTDLILIPKSFSIR